ncbi:MAG: peptide ABC transporter substrate-binding protein [Firmicutes bacterium HGW-Firmicutes-16]|nr:MAG: peptide ABC transporter substrate-binding protein [Firmicutes bacterium HGW-Firmicutes-16]
MRRTKKAIAFFIALMMLASVLAGCGEDNVTQSAAPSATTAASNFDLSLCLTSEPTTIDPALNAAVDGAIMIQHFFEGLMKWADDGEGNAKLVLGQAASMDKVVNSDGTVTYTFKLRPDAKWSDGTAVTANDFVYSWQRLATPATAAGYAAMIDMVKGYNEVHNGTPTGKFETKTNADTGLAEEVEVIDYADPGTLSVSAPDAGTFVVTLTYDCSYFQEICAFPATYPVRKDIIDSQGDQWTFTPETYMSNGPYKLSEWKHNSYIKGVKNNNYYDLAKLGPDSLTFYLMDDASAIYSAFKSGTLQFIENVPNDEVATLLKSGELQLEDYLGTSYACFNVNKAPFDDARVREALSLAIDRNYIVEKVNQTGENAATAFVPNGIYDADSSAEDFRSVGGDYYSVKTEDYEANCEKARQLLSDAGYPNGEGFPTVEYLYNKDDRNEAVAEALQQMWKTELGVSLTLSSQDWGVVMQTVFSGEFQIARFTWTADYNDPASFLDIWYTNNGNNVTGYSNPKFDEQIDIAKASTEPAKRMEAYHKAEDILIGDDMVVAPLSFFTQMYMLDPTIEGVYYSPLGYFFFGYASKAAA